MKLDQLLAMASWCLPEDLVIQILLRLPVKSLLRFKCVCKRWCALTRNPSFIAMHLNSNSSNGLGSWNDNSDGLIVGHDGYHVFPKCWYGEQPVDLTFGFMTNPNSLLGPCDGIFCLYWSPHDILRSHFRLPGIVLWNPATREVNMLPKSSFNFPPYKPVDDCIVGFGFDGKAKTYKVVKIVSFEGDGDDWFNCGEVYTLSSCCWRFLPVGGEVRDVELFGVANISMYTHDGVFHWCFYQKNDDVAVVSFDMGVEVFRVTPLPKMFNLFPLTDDQIKECSLTLLKDSLAVICSFSDYVSTTFALWVMKENYKVEDVESCWFLVSTWGPLPGLCTSLGFGKNNELLIRTGCGSEFGGSPFLYNIVTKKVRELKLSGEPNFIYKQSLVSVTGGN